MKKVYKNFGFTLIELLVAITILSILAIIGLASFRTAQVKARDSRRKNDLEQLQRAMEMYLNDFGVYPSSTNGQIVMGINLFCHTLCSGS